MTVAVDPIDRVLAALRDHGSQPRQSRPGQWNARCPNTAAHSNGDRNPSLSVGIAADHRVLIHCQTGCPLETITHALGIAVADLYPPRETNGHTRTHIPIVVDTYDYCDADGERIFQVVRLDPKSFRQRRNVNGQWVWNLQGVTTKPLYRLPRLLAAIAAGTPIWVVEGERDVHTLEAHGHTATTNPGGAGKWLPEHTAILTDATVNIVADNDQPGRNHALTIAAQLPHARLWLPANPHKDITDHLDAGLTLDQLQPLNQPDEPEQAPHRLRANLHLGDRILHLPAVEWLIDGVIQAGGHTVTYGAPKSYKTFVTLDQALHIANGIPWRGLHTVTGRVLYVVAEGAPGVGPRADAWCKHHGGTLANMAWITVAPDLFDHRIGSDTDEITAIAIELAVDLIIVDTLARSMAGGDENSGRDMGVVVGHLDAIREATNAAIQLVHHTGKDAARGMRGHSSLQGAVDTSIEVIGDKYAVNARVVDQKNAESDAAWWWKPVKVASSVVLQPTEGLESSSEVRDVNILRQLQLIDAGDGVSNTAWSDAVEERGICSRTTFLERVAAMREAGLLVKGEGHRGTWRLTRIGFEKLRSATE